MFRWTALFLFMAITGAAASPAVAQSTATTTGNYMLGGTMSWQSVDNNYETESSDIWTISPRVMYFWIDNLAFGAELGFSGTWNGGVGGSSLQRYFAVAEYVLPTGGKNFRFFGEVGGGFSRWTSDTVGFDLAINGWGLMGGIGAYMFLNDHVAITPEITYIYDNFSPDGRYTRGEDQTIQLRIGVSGFLFP